MKAAFFFSSNNEDGFYGLKFEKLVYTILLKNRTLNISSKIFTGDLLLHMHNASNPKENVEKLLQTKKHIWAKLNLESLIALAKHDIYTICFESIDYESAEYISFNLESAPSYIGAIEVDDCSPFHWVLFSNTLSPRYRIMSKNINLFYDEDCDEKDNAMMEWLQKIGFNKVNYENLNGLYSIFDKYHNFEHARRVAEWKNIFGGLLAFTADSTVHRLSDCAPEIGDRLWAIVTAYNEAETNEQFAQACTSCRRLIEYVTDMIFPPSDENMNGHNLGKNAYKNRLLAFADKEKQSNTSCELIFASQETLNAQIDKLNNLSNKGVHAEVFRNEARRCLIRSILLLDDIISLKVNPFVIKPDLDFSFVENFNDSF